MNNTKSQTRNNKLAEKNKTILLKWDNDQFNRLITAETKEIPSTCKNPSWSFPLNSITTIMASGGTGKSFLALDLAFSASTGSKYGEYDFNKPYKTLVLLGEDEEPIFQQRIKHINRDRKSKNENLNIRNVKNFRLVEFETNTRNPKITQNYETLKDFIKENKIEILILDPYIKFFGLDENNNPDADYFINRCNELGVTTILVAHLAKDASNDTNIKNIDELTPRGAKSLYDGSRCVVAMIALKIDENKKKLKWLENNYEDFEVVATKPIKVNYAKKPTEPMYLYRDDNGVLNPIEPDKAIFETAKNMLFDMIKRFYSNTEFEYKLQSGETVNFCNKTKGKLTPNVLKYQSKATDNEQKEAITTIQAVLKDIGIDNIQSQIDKLLEALTKENKISITRQRQGKKEINLL